MTDFRDLFEINFQGGRTPCQGDGRQVLTDLLSRPPVRLRIPYNTPEDRSVALEITTFQQCRYVTSVAPAAISFDENKLE